MGWLIPPVLFLICILTMVAFRQWLPLYTLFPLPYNLLGLLPLALGLGFSLRAALLFATEQTNIHAFKEPDLLVKKGVFRFSRNPMYLGLLVALASLAILLAHLSAWFPVLLFFVIADRWYIPSEEKAMAKKFGEAYEHYRTQTKRWL